MPVPISHVTPIPKTVLFEDRMDTPQPFSIVPKIVGDPSILHRRYDSAKWAAAIYQNTDRLDPAKDPAGVGCSISVSPTDGDMDTCLTDGGTEWWIDPITKQKFFLGGVAYSTFKRMPKMPAIDLSEGKVCTIETEWTARNAPRRWQDVILMPFGDRIVMNKWRDDHNSPTQSKNALMLSCGHANWQAFQFDAVRGIQPISGQWDHMVTGGKSPIDMTPAGLLSWRVTPPMGSMSDKAFKTDPYFNGTDDDIRFMRMHSMRFELSATHVKVYEQGFLKVDWTYTVPLAWAGAVQFGFLQQLYHSRNAVDDAKASVDPCPSWLSGPGKFSDARCWGPVRISVSQGAA